MKSFILLIGIMVMAAAAHADTYEWTDNQGGVHFTDNLDNVPARYKDKVRKMDVRPVIDKTEAPPPAQPSAAPAHQKAASLYGGHDGMWWRSSFKALRDEMKKIQDYLPGKRAKSTAIHRRYTIFFKPSDRVALNDVNADIEHDEARITELQQQLADLDSEATKAGVPFEWRQ